MKSTTRQEKIVLLRRRFDLLQNQMNAASEQGDLRLKALLCLQACRVRRRLVETQAATLN